MVNSCLGAVKVKAVAASGLLVSWDVRTLLRPRRRVEQIVNTRPLTGCLYCSNQYQQRGFAGWCLWFCSWVCSTGGVCHLYCKRWSWLPSLVPLTTQAQTGRPRAYPPFSLLPSPLTVRTDVRSGFQCKYFLQERLHCTCWLFNSQP